MNYETHTILIDQPDDADELFIDGYFASVEYDIMDYSQLLNRNPGYDPHKIVKGIKALHNYIQWRIYENEANHVYFAVPERDNDEFRTNRDECEIIVRALNYYIRNYKLCAKFALSQEPLTKS